MQQVGTIAPIIAASNLLTKFDKVLPKNLKLLYLNNNFITKISSILPITLEILDLNKYYEIVK